MRGEGYSLSDIAAATGNNGNGGFGNNGDWAWIIVLFLIFGYGRGFGGFGGGYGNGGTSVYEGYVLNNDFSQLSKQISDSYSMTERKLDGINNGLCSLGYQELQNITGVNTNLFNGFANLNTAITTNGYEDRIAINGVGTQLSNCCCDLKAQLADNKYEMAKGFCSTNNTIAMSTRDIVDNMNANYRALHDEIVANRIEDKNAQITAQQNEINALRLAASQTAQNEYLVNKLRPCPIPAYASCNPWGCNCNQGCGCNM